MAPADRTATFSTDPPPSALPLDRTAILSTGFADGLGTRKRKPQVDRLLSLFFRTAKGKTGRENSGFVHLNLILVRNAQRDVGTQRNMLR